MPVLSKIEAERNQPGRVRLYLDGEYAFSIALPLVADYYLERGKILNEEQIVLLKADDVYQQVFSYCLNFLAGRPRSEHEVRERLGRREYAAPAIDRAINRLKELNLINDNSFADSWIKNRANLSPRGSMLLRQELRAKGVDAETIDRALDRSFTDVGEEDNGQTGLKFDQGELCEQAARKKANTMPGKDWTLFQRRLMGYLQRRGFSYSLSRNVTRMLWQERSGAEPDDLADENDDF